MSRVRLRLDAALPPGADGHRRQMLTNETSSLATTYSKSTTAEIRLASEETVTIQAHRLVRTMASDAGSFRYQVDISWPRRVI